MLVRVSGDCKPFVQSTHFQSIVSITHCYSHTIELHAHKRNSSKCSPYVHPLALVQGGSPFVLYNKLTNGRNSLLGLPWQSAAGGQSEGGETAIKRLLLTNAELMPPKNENGVRNNRRSGYVFSFILTVVWNEVKVLQMINLHGFFFLRFWACSRSNLGATFWNP
jgi:hypothetical protein